MTNSKDKAFENGEPLTSRRKFIATSALITTGIALAPTAIAQGELTLLSENDPIAVSLGYRADASTVDLAKYPGKAGDGAVSQKCSNCSLYKAAGEGNGACAAIPGRLVAGAGWCSVWNPAA